MALRTATAKGTVRNTGNVRSSYQVNLWTDILDQAGLLVISLQETSPVTLDPGGISSLITLTKSYNLLGDWQMVAHVTLDLTAPVSKKAMSVTTPVTFTEGAVYGGTWEGVPTIGYHLEGGVGRLMDALVEAGTR